MFNIDHILFKIFNEIININININNNIIIVIKLYI